MAVCKTRTSNKCAELFDFDLIWLCNKIIQTIEISKVVVCALYKKKFETEIVQFGQFSQTVHLWNCLLSTFLVHVHTELGVATEII